MNRNQYSLRQTIPGVEMGITSMSQLHKINDKLLRRRGFFFRPGVGQNTFNIQLSGKADLLCGFLVFDESSDPQNNITITINNDVRVEQVSCSSVCRIWERPINDSTFGINPYDEEFFPLIAPLSGNDSITIEYNAVTGTNLFITFYYLGS